ncbi:transcription termination factor 2 isoform X2 [Drosophila tropicalis]|uniref:transcription termination factor 2 isoform X2 n=1 Tax=Drosophila tropicalis TaxID=46794 RepID=UPI0035ABAC8B
MEPYSQIIKCVDLTSDQQTTDLTQEGSDSPSITLCGSLPHFGNTQTCFNMSKTGVAAVTNLEEELLDWDCDNDVWDSEFCCPECARVAANDELRYKGLLDGDFNHCTLASRKVKGAADYLDLKNTIMDCVKALHEPVEPSPEEIAEQPVALLVPLLKHQQRGLKWLQYREKQAVRGGILADDMGLGKTLSMISLMLSTIQETRKQEDIKRKALETEWNRQFYSLQLEQKKPVFSLFSYDDEDQTDENKQPTNSWQMEAKPLFKTESVQKEEKPMDPMHDKEITDNDSDCDIGPYGRAGTLIICPMSVMHQWANEATSKVTANYIKILIYHGPKRRKIDLETLLSYDMVITSYHTVAMERKRLYDSSILFGVKWHRVILDEAHVIRNLETACCSAVCALDAKYRWAVTGTPVHNKAIDVLALLSFLKVPNFKSFQQCKDYLNQGIKAHCRLHAIIKPLMLRRTKSELQQSGEMPSLPELIIEVIQVTLSDAELVVYQILSSISQSIFEQYLRQRREGNLDLNYYCNDKTPTFMPRIFDTTYSELYRRFLKSMGYTPGFKVQGIVILVLLLRLRQFCCHPGLMVQMICDTFNPEDFNEMNEDIDEMVGHLKTEILAELDNYNPTESQALNATHEASLLKIKKEEKTFKQKGKIKYEDENYNYISEEKSIFKFQIKKEENLLVKQAIKMDYQGAKQ